MTPRAIIKLQYPHGYFADPATWLPLPESAIVVHAAWMRDGRSMRVLLDAGYVDPDGQRWFVSRGVIVDGLSSPRVFWRIAPPFVGKAREASVFHDTYCVTRTRSSVTVHRMFYQAMRANGVWPIQAYTRWLAVRLFGPRFSGVSK